MLDAGYWIKYTTRGLKDHKSSLVESFGCVGWTCDSKRNRVVIFNRRSTATAL
ncbi:MAG: hypothetical protein M0Q38_15610 [Bacteroidales bacterium]|nr:hypothetical protein [Bacteroidales bacterium]